MPEVEQKQEKIWTMSEAMKSLRESDLAAERTANARDSRPKETDDDPDQLRFRADKLGNLGLCCDGVNGWETPHVSSTVNNVDHLYRDARAEIARAMQILKTDPAAFTDSDRDAIRNFFDAKPRIDEIDHLLRLAEADHIGNACDRTKLLADRRANVEEQAQKLREIEAAEAPLGRKVANLEHLRNQIVKDYEMAYDAARKVVKEAASRTMLAHLLKIRERCNQASARIVESPDWSEAVVLALATHLAYVPDFVDKADAIFEELASIAVKLPAADEKKVEPTVA